MISPNNNNVSLAGITVRDFLENYLGMYCNPHGVVMTINKDETISLASAFYRTVTGCRSTLGVAYESGNMNSFIETFGIDSVHDLDDITAMALMGLYQQGRAEVYCSLDVDGGLLCFRRDREVLLAKDDYDVEHEVGEVLETAESFVRYTREYFEEGESLKLEE